MQVPWRPALGRPCPRVAFGVGLIRRSLSVPAALLSRDPLPSWAGTKGGACGRYGLRFCSMAVFMPCVAGVVASVGFSLMSLSPSRRGWRARSCPHILCPFLRLIQQWLRGRPWGQHKPDSMWLLSTMDASSARSGSVLWTALSNRVQVALRFSLPGVGAT